MDLRTPSSFKPALFIYGTLLSPQVCQAVLGRMPEGVDGVAKGYGRYALAGRAYPAIRKDEGNQVRGRILFIDEKDLIVLDYYESDEYLRQPILVTNTETGTETSCEAYVARDYIHNDMKGEWTLEHFEQNDLPEYLEDTKAFMEDLDDEHT